MYKELILKLETKGIKFEKGLTGEEILNIEKRYAILFPEELKQFFSIALPISDGFYNWRNFNDENVRMIMRKIETPFLDLKEYIDEIYWCDDWGEEPENIEARNDFLMKKINTAPKLIPMYSHRYIANNQSIQNPVFSIHGTDVIYYGENLKSYLEIEFGIKEYSDMKIENIIPVSFWSDLL